MVVTVQGRIRSRSARRVGGSLLSSILLLALAFLFTPAFAPQPYQLDEALPQLVDIPDEIEIPPPPKDEPMPRPDPVWVEDPNASDDASIDDDKFDFDKPVPPEPPEQDDKRGAFVGYEEAPVPVFQVMPRYPELARDAGLTGVVHVRFDVDERGRVIRVTIVSSTAAHSLEEAALTAARKWRFRAGRQGTHPVRTSITLPFEFVLR